MRRRSGSNTTAENCPRGFTARRFSALTALAVVILAAGPAGIWAEDISIQANVHPQRARVGEHLQLVVTVEGKANLRESPQLPDLQDFQVYGGGRSSNFTFVNGQVSSTLQFTYVLVPKRAGQLVVGPVQITYQGKSYSTQPIPVVVSNASQGYSPSAPAGAAPAPPAAIPGAKPGEPAETPQQAQEAVFITTASDRKSVYVNEPLV
ncbi:BatD family protein, partial [candidate division FCPU426 bacterium]|nr:BatD family protein [candidate division FCPU426 bacterium]